jgi:hypothetical protein
VEGKVVGLGGYGFWAGLMGQLVGHDVGLHTKDRWVGLR